MNGFKKWMVLIFLMAPLGAVSAGSADSKYQLKPGDVLNVTVHEQPDLTTKTRVTSDGVISFPLVGKISAKGLTVQQLEEELKAALEKDYLVDAQVLVFIEEYCPRQVSVVGQVRRPGKFDMPDERELTLLEAVAMAEGFTKDAYTKTVKIIRMEGGEQKTITVDAKKIMEQGDPDVVLKPDDVVVVPESFF